MPEGLSLPVLLVALASLVFCAAARTVGPMLGLMDHPDVRKKHAVSTPLMGGLVVVACVIPALVYSILAQPGELSVAWGLVIAVAAMGLLGLFDDIVDQPALHRLLIAAIVFVGTTWAVPDLRLSIVEFQQPRITFVLDRAWVSIGFTSICCVGLINAINMADGKNGLVPGLLLGWAILLLSIATGPLDGLLLIVTAGIAVLFVFNIRGHLFLGDGGAYGLATGLGLLAIAIYNSPANTTPRPLSADGVLVLFMVPVLDMFRLMVTRVCAGNTPFTPGRDHLHHYLQNWLSWPGGLIAYWCLALVPGYLKIIFHLDSNVLAYAIIIWRFAKGSRVAAKNH
jgi:UDP-GlcNAc:undecaprenyl-phosphate/decaprenyl-phosphate GlcNAc-1-phosphate transferase